MPSRIVRNEHDRDQAAIYVQNMKPPFRIDVEQGSLRSLEQNALSHVWYREIADQRGDVTPDEVRAECKLVFGVPILREENPKFREVYDKHLRPRSYEEKCDFIRITELPITRLMTMRQLSRYLDAVSQYAAKMGFRLTEAA